MAPKGVLCIGCRCKDKLPADGFGCPSSHTRARTPHTSRNMRSCLYNQSSQRAQTTAKAHLVRVKGRTSDPDDIQNVTRTFLSIDTYLVTFS